MIRVSHNYSLTKLYKEMVVVTTNEDEIESETVQHYLSLLMGPEGEFIVQPCLHYIISVSEKFKRVYAKKYFLNFE